MLWASIDLPRKVHDIVQALEDEDGVEDYFKELDSEKDKWLNQMSMQFNDQVSLSDLFGILQVEYFQSYRLRGFLSPSKAKLI